MTKITVTQKLIDTGMWGECYSCPIALAVRVHTRPFTIIRVDRIDVDFEYSGYYAAIPLPPEASKFVVDFDNDMLTVPFEFELAIPKWALKEVV